jgi:hypothetical protein
MHMVHKSKDFRDWIFHGSLCLFTSSAARIEA